MNQETTKKIEEEYRLVYGEEHPGVVSANKSTFLHATRFGYNLASEELKRKDEEIAAYKAKEHICEEAKKLIGLHPKIEDWTKEITDLQSLLQSREDECKRLMNVISVVNDYPLEHHPQGIKDEINLLLAQSEKL